MIELTLQKIAFKWSFTSSSVMIKGDVEIGTPSVCGLCSPNLNHLNRFSNRSNMVSSRENLIDRKFQAVTFPDSTAGAPEGAPDDKSVGSGRVKSLM